MGPKKGTNRVKQIPAPSLEQLPLFAENNWSVSFRYVSREGDFAWPTDQLEFQQLASTLLSLTSYPWDDFQSHTRYIGAGSSHHFRYLAELQDCARDAVSSHTQLAERTFDSAGAELFSVRLCNANNAPERIWGIFKESVFFPLWWDRDHAFSGNKRWKARGICPADCMHPASPAFFVN